MSSRSPLEPALRRPAPCAWSWDQANSHHLWPRLAALELPGEEAGTPRERLAAMAASVARSLIETPDFLRLGLMLALERRPVEAAGRTVFLRARRTAMERIAEMTARLVPDLAPEQTRFLVTYSIATADGLFIAHEVDGDGVDLIRLFQLHASLVYDAALEMASPRSTATSTSPEVSREQSRHEQ